MMNTPTGKSAFSNPIYKPIKENGELVKGFKNTYKRQNWNSPAYTITMDNVKISSQNNVHPGRCVGKDELGINIYSNPRVFSDNWSVPNGSSEAFIRRVMGEGIPPLLTKKIFNTLKS